LIREAFVWAILPKGQTAAEQHVHEAAHAPHICLGVVTPTAIVLDNFRGHVVEGAVIFPDLRVHTELGEAEVCDTQICVGLVRHTENVFRFEVAVHYAALMHVLTRKKHVANHLGNLLLCESSSLEPLERSFEKITPRCELHHNPVPIW